MKKFLSANQEYLITAAVVLVCVVAGIAIYHLSLQTKVEAIKAKRSTSKMAATKTIPVEETTEVA